jgi:predicted acylesterase/phospholipase RssA
LIVSRLTQHHEIRTPPKTIVVVCDPGGDVFAEEFVVALRNLGDHVRFIHHPETSAIARIVAEAEDEGSIVVFANDTIEEHRVRAMLRQADVVVTVSRGSASPAAAIVDSELRSRPHQPRVESVCIDGSRPPGLAMQRGVRRHRAGKGSDGIARIARLVSGRSNTLVLGSGAARGIAHVGVIAALDELGVVVDAIGGSSAGAVVAGMWAHGVGPGQMRDDIVGFLETVRWSKDLTVPSVALLSGRQLSDAIEAYFSGATIEDLAVNMFAVSSDLVSGESYVHDRGPVWRALRASSSIPGIFPPVRDGARLLADGAILDRLPVATMSELHPASRIIAVDLGHSPDLAIEGHAADGRLARSTALRFAGKKGPSGLGTLMARIVELTGGGATEVPAILIQPESTSTAGLTPADMVDAVIASGYWATMKAMQPMPRSPTATGGNGSPG